MPNPNKYGNVLVLLKYTYMCQLRYSLDQLEYHLPGPGSNSSRYHA